MKPDPYAFTSACLEGCVPGPRKKPRKRFCCHRVLISGRGAMGDGYDCAKCDWISYSLPANPLWWLLHIFGLTRIK